MSRHTRHTANVTTLTFRVNATQATEAQARASRLGIPLSELLRDALRHHLVALHAEAEQPLGHIADWGPEEDWSDWIDATR